MIRVRISLKSTIFCRICCWKERKESKRGRDWPSQKTFLLQDRPYKSASMSKLVQWPKGPEGLDGPEGLEHLSQAKKYFAESTPLLAIDICTLFTVFWLFLRAHLRGKKALGKVTKYFTGRRWKRSSRQEAVWPDWAIYWTLANFLKPLAKKYLSKPLTFLGIFLVKSLFGNFYRHLAIFSGHTGRRWNFVTFNDIFLKKWAIPGLFFIFVFSIHSWQ